MDQNDAEQRMDTVHRTINQHKLFHAHKHTHTQPLVVVVVRRVKCRTLFLMVSDSFCFTISEKPVLPVISLLCVGLVGILRAGSRRRHGVNLESYGTSVS